MDEGQRVHMMDRQQGRSIARSAVRVACAHTQGGKRTCTRTEKQHLIALKSALNLHLIALNLHLIALKEHLIALNFT